MDESNKKEMMKYFLILITQYLIFTISIAQSDSSAIVSRYRQWEKSVKKQDTTSHLSHYASTDVQIHLVKKDSIGSQLFGLFTAKQFMSFWNPSEPFELRISDINVHPFKQFAFTDARFDEYINNEYTSTGRDLFTYIKKEDCWQLFTLHNTFELAHSPKHQKDLPTVNIEAQLKALELAISNKNQRSIDSLFLSPMSRIGINDTTGWSTVNANILSNTLQLSIKEMIIEESYNVDIYLQIYKGTFNLQDDKSETNHHSFLISCIPHKGYWYITSLLLDIT